MKIEFVKFPIYNCEFIPSCTVCNNKPALYFFDIYINDCIKEMYNYICNSKECEEYLKLKYC